MSPYLRKVTSSLLLLLIISFEITFTVTNAYDFFLEGFNSDLSYSNDVESVLITDTNRYADGVTSAASFDITSPHFPQYYNALANVSDRYLRYTKYMENAAEQGIAGYGDGDKIREDAKIKIISQENYTSLPPPTKTFPVYASIKWNPSDFAIQEGEYYNISVIGGRAGGFSPQFWSDGGIRVNADGYTSYYDAISKCYVGFGRCRPHLKRKRRLQSANWMSLACAVGQFVRNVNAIQPGKEDITSWIPLDESALQGTIFNVGHGIVFRAEYSGQLICFANDAHSLYWNNQGQLEVTATRVSWPPSDVLYYKPLELPACDSAYAVYRSLAPPDCNPDGGGAGWDPKNVASSGSGYSSGIPDELLYG